MSCIKEAGGTIMIKKSLGFAFRRPFKLKLHNTVAL